MAVESLQGHGSTLDHPARKYAQLITRPTVIVLHELFPGLTPNDLSHLCVATEGFASGWAYSRMRRNRSGEVVEPWQHTFLKLLVAAFPDAVDGELKRYLEEVFGIQSDPNGGTHDAFGDRMSEDIRAIFRALDARDRGDVVGEIMAVAVVPTSVWPSLEKAKRGAEGKKSAEVGGGGFGVGGVGTRIGRWFLGSLGQALPEYKGIPVQAICDGLIVAGNFVNAWHRHAHDRDLPVTLDMEARQAAEKRAQALWFAAGIGAGLAVGYGAARLGESISSASRAQVEV